MKKKHFVSNSNKPEKVTYHFKTNYIKKENDRLKENTHLYYKKN